MKYIFTKKFFDLSPTDQALVVNAQLQELETSIYLTEKDECEARKKAAYIRQKSIELGIMEVI